MLSKAPKARIKVGFKSDIWALGVILFQVCDCDSRNLLDLFKNIPI